MTEAELRDALLAVHREADHLRVEVASLRRETARLVREKAALEKKKIELEILRRQDNAYWKTRVRELEAGHQPPPPQRGRSGGG